VGFRHGIYISEVPTSIVPPVQTSAGIPVVFGTAPINLAADGKGITNQPVLAYTYAEAVAALGYSDDWGKYTLCEFMYSHFSLFAVAPIVFVNVIDQGKHIKTIVSPATANLNLSAGQGKLPAGILMGTLKISITSGGLPLASGTDYTATFADDGTLIISRIKLGTITTDTAPLFASYTQLDPTMVTSADIIGGVDITTGSYKGLELISQVFPKYRVVPGQICAPYWSTKPEVAAVMEAKAGSINGVFRCISLVDIPTDIVKKYSDAPAWKNTNNYVFSRQYVCWPKVSLGEKVFHMSTQVAGLNCLIDSGNDDIPYESPSNKNLQMNSLVLADGTEVTFGIDEANYLNSQGIATALNWIGGWKLWGNRTAAYPANTDPKDSFLSIRRMFDWQGNTFIQTYWQKVDKPMNRVLVESIVDSENIRMNGLAARGFILGGRVEFLSTENPTTSLLNGGMTFHTHMTPPTPAEDIEDILEYDTSYLSTLFK